MDSSEFFGTEAPPPDPQGYDRHGRYLLDADGTGQQAYTRATTLAKTLDDGRGLAIWGQRKAAKGVAMSPALTARAAVTPLDEKRVWREIIEQAEVKSGGDEKRDWGSAFHEFHERVPDMTDDEYAAQAVELRVTYERYRAELDRLGITEVLTEGTCVNQQIGTAGKFDAVFRLADGRLVIGDRKTGRVVEYPHAPAVQLAVYANADTMIEFDKSGAQHRVPMPDVDKTIAIVVDITVGDEQTAAAHVYEVDIHAGWYGALLAAKVRRWRNRKDLIAPYHPEFPPSDKALAAAAVEPIRIVSMSVARAEQILPVSPEMTAELVTGRTAPAEPGAGISTATNSVRPVSSLPENQAWFEQQAPGQQQPVEPADRPDANTSAGMSATAKAVLGTGPAIGTGNAVQPPHAGTHPAWSSKDQKVIALDSKGERVEPTTPQEARATGGRTAAELDADALLEAFKTKAAIQDVGRRVGLTNLSRTRANLAKDIVAHPAWPSLRATLLPNQPGVMSETQLAGAVAREYGDEPESFSPVVTNAPGPVPPDPEPAMGGERGNALEHLEQASAQQFEANPFRPSAAPVAAPVKTPEDTFVERIVAATSFDDLAAIWDDAVNKAGIGWPPRLEQAASIRTRQIEQEGK